MKTELVELVNFRNSQNLSPEEMADEIGISRSFYYKVEQGSRNPSYNFMVKIKKRFPEIDINIILKKGVDENETA